MQKELPKVRKDKQFRKIIQIITSADIALTTPKDDHGSQLGQRKYPSIAQ